jgi:hypothetical protein
MRTYDAVLSVPQGGYGPSLQVGPGSKFVDAGARIGHSDSALIDAAAKFLGKKSVGELEAVVTSGWIKVREHQNDPEQIAMRLVELKPHILVPSARMATLEATHFLARQSIV